jgi:Ribbon-helix-helix protein, copG family
VSRQLTIRTDDDLAEEIERLAAAEGTSRNRVVLRLLRQAAGLEKPAAADEVGDSLDWFIGSWSEERAQELERAFADFEEIDAELWK